MSFVCPLCFRDAEPHDWHNVARFKTQNERADHMEKAHFFPAPHAGESIDQAVIRFETDNPDYGKPDVCRCPSCRPTKQTA